MPINNSTPAVQNPTKIKLNEAPSTCFMEHLSSIDVRLLSAPTYQELKSYIPEWGTATWADKPDRDISNYDREKVLQDLFDGKILPSAMETIGLVFLISNIDLVDVTHLLRHRSLSFSAICTADRDLRHDDCLVKPSIMSSVFSKRYLSLVRQCKALYVDMVDTEEISLLDARTILPRSLENHYYVRGNIKDIIAYIKQRLDRQIQPESDNIVALKMWIEVVRQYPMIKNLINLNEPDMWYIKTAPTGRSSNIYMPEVPRNDVFKYRKDWFLYKKQRSEMKGGQIFLSIWKQLINQLEAI